MTYINFDRSLTLLPPSPTPAAMPHLVCFPAWSTLLPVFSAPLSRLPELVFRCVPIPRRLTIPPISWDFQRSLLVTDVFAVTRLSSLVFLPSVVSASSMLIATLLRRLLVPFPGGSELMRESLLERGLRWLRRGIGTALPVCKPVTLTGWLTLGKWAFGLFEDNWEELRADVYISALTLLRNLNHAAAVVTVITVPVLIPPSPRVLSEFWSCLLYCRQWADNFSL